MPSCPACGYEFRDSEGTNSVKKLASQIEALEEHRGKKKLREMFGATLGYLSKVDEQKINLIRNFPIPNTKEDVLEFAILASSNIDVKSYGISGVNNKVSREISDAWMSKFEQAYQKAKLLFESSAHFHNIDTLFCEKKKQIKQEKRKFTLFIALIATVFLLLLLFPLLLALFLVYCTP